MRIDNYNAIEKEVKIWFDIDLSDSLKLIKRFNAVGIQLKI